MIEVSQEKLVSKYEPILYKISLFFSIILWFILIVWTFWLWAIYVWIAALIYLIAHIAFISHVKWNWTKVTKSQFPELDKIKKEIAEQMWFTTYTNMYIVNIDGILNAFATRLLSRNFIILSSSIVEACDNDIDKLRFIIAHELAHIKRKHVHRQALLMPSKIIPWLWNAYSKACEYTCDNYWVYYWTKNVEKAIKWLAVLSVWWIYSEKINIDEYLEQAKFANDFWMSLNETKSTHPYLVKRIFNIVKTFENPNLSLPRRNIFGIILAPLTSMWLWIFIIYAVIIWTAIMEQYKKHTDENYVDNYEYSSSDSSVVSLSEGYRELFKDLFKKYKNSPSYEFYLYVDNVKNYNWQYIPLMVLDLKDNKYLLVSGAWKKYTLPIDDNSIWWFEIYDNKNDITFSETTDINIIKNYFKD